MLPKDPGMQGCRCVATEGTPLERTQLCSEICLKADNCKQSPSSVQERKCVYLTSVELVEMGLEETQGRAQFGAGRGALGKVVQLFMRIFNKGRGFVSLLLEA